MSDHDERVALMLTGLFMDKFSPGETFSKDDAAMMRGVMEISHQYGMGNPVEDVEGVVFSTSGTESSCVICDEEE